MKTISCKSSLPKRQNKFRQCATAATAVLAKASTPLKTPQGRLALTMVNGLQRGDDHQKITLNSQIALLGKPEVALANIVMQSLLNSKQVYDGLDQHEALSRAGEATKALGLSLAMGVAGMKIPIAVKALSTGLGEPDPHVRATKEVTSVVKKVIQS